MSVKLVDILDVLILFKDAMNSSIAATVLMSHYNILCLAHVCSEGTLFLLYFLCLQ